MFERFRIAAILLPATLSACVMSRMHTEAELADVTRACGLAAGELIQDEEAPKILLLMRPGAKAAERRCAAQWAKRNHLHFAFVEGIDFKEK